MTIPEFEYVSLPFSFLFFLFQLKRGMQFGMHMRWHLSVEQTRINPFIRNAAKLPCRQALHLKCTISYPCLV